jgi:hypothetical protein
MVTGRGSGKLRPAVTPGTPRATPPAPLADVVQATRPVRATVSLVVAPPSPALPPRLPGDGVGRGTGGDRPTGGASPRCGFFSSGGGGQADGKRQPSRIRAPRRTNPGFRAGARREKSPPSVPDTNPPDADPGSRPWQDARATAPTPAEEEGQSTEARATVPILLSSVFRPLIVFFPEPARGGGSASGPRVGPRGRGRGSTVTNGSARHEESVHHGSGRQDL